MYSNIGVSCRETVPLMEKVEITLISSNSCPFPVKQEDISIFPFKLYTQLYSLTDPTGTAKTKSSCIFEYSMLDKSALVEGVKYLQGKSMELSGVATDTAMKADVAKMAALANFVTAFNSICADWVHQITNVIGELDTLQSLQFPDSLKGKIEMSSCLTGNGHAFVNNPMANVPLIESLHVSHFK